MSSQGELEESKLEGGQQITTEDSFTFTEVNVSRRPRARGRQKRSRADFEDAKNDSETEDILPPLHPQRRRVAELPQSEVETPV